MHASATGLAFLAASTNAFIADYLAEDLAPRTDRTITDPDVLRELIETIRPRGYSVNDQGLSTGITALGAAITNARDEPIGAISVSGPSSRMTPDKLDELGVAVRDTALRIHAAL